MKSLWFSLAFFCISATVTGTDSIPEAVQRAFTQLYPEVKSPLWESRHEGIVATFRDTEGLKKAFFREDGRWTETRVMMRQEQLPKGVNRFIQEHYRDADITFTGKVYTPNGTWYRIESELPNKVILKTLDANGNLLEEETVTFSTSLEMPKVIAPAPNLLPTKSLRIE